MKKTLLFMKSLLAILTLMAATSCTKYNIKGSSDMENFDGHMLYLKGFRDGELADIDSSEVVHGKFQFSGALDSLQVVTLCIDDTPVMPVVLENGNIVVELNDQRQICKGTPLNDTLTIFNKQYSALVSKIEDLAHQQSQAIMNGEDMDIVNQRLAQQEQQLIIQEDKLISGFISDNFDNCLGPYVFQLATSSYEYPILTPWIDALMTKATETFKNSPYVKEYMSVAKQNQDIMTGVADSGTPQIPPVPQADLPTPPTPNDMAKPAAE